MNAMTQHLLIKPIRELRPYPRNARKHSAKQIRQVAASIERFGFTILVLIDETGMILAGHCRVEAARQLGWTEVPCVLTGRMTESEKRAYILADNRLAMSSTWDDDLLANELSSLIIEAPDLDITLTGFSLGVSIGPQ